MELQLRVSTAGHHLPHGGEGSVVRITNTSDTGDDVAGIGNLHSLS